MFDFRFGYLRRCLVATLVATGLIVSIANPAAACPFCNAVSQTLRQEMSAMDAVVIAEALQDDLTRDKETGEILMKVHKVLKGSDHVSVGDQVRAIYYGEA